MSAVSFDKLASGALSCTRDITGRIVEARRTAQIVGIEQTSFAEWMTAAYAALPAHGSTLPVFNTILNLEDTIVTVRDKAVADVELVYKYWERSGGAALQNALTMDGALQVRKTNKDPDDATKPLTVPYNDEVISGEYDAYEPQSTIEVVLYEQAPTPWPIVNGWRGRVNEFDWAGGAPGTWMCMGVRVTPANLNAEPEPEWRFAYSFQYDETGWQPEVIAINPETGQPFEDVTIPVAPQTIGNGARRLEGRYPSLDFRIKFP